MLRNLFFIFLLLSFPAMAQEKQEKHELATIAGGCFWCMEPIFASERGVIKVTAGYAGGTTVNPTYENIGDHMESAQIEYDPAKVSYEDILKIYWFNIDPFDAGGQFYDRGSHYYTAIFYHNEAQKKIAEKTKAELEKKHGKKVATQILAYKNFYLAEDYHQDYYKKNPVHYNAYKYGSGREEKLKQIHHE